MNELGQMLREAREARNISLAEAEAQTRIRQKFIAALEAEEWDLLPNEVTTRGFLRRYTTFLGLDEEAAVQLFQQRPGIGHAQSDINLPTQREVDYRPIEMNLASSPLRTLPRGWLPATLLGALLLAGALLLLFRPQFISNLLAMPRELPAPGDVIALEPTATPTATAQIDRITATPTATIQPTATPAKTATAVPTTTTVLTGTVALTTTTGITTTVPAQAFQPVDKIVLDLEITARSWIRLLTDNGLASEAVLEPGTKQTWEARQSMVLRTGNAAGVVVKINGQTQPQMGGTGEVVEMQWQLTDGVITAITPVPAQPAEQPAQQPAPTDTPVAAPEATPVP